MPPKPAQPRVWQRWLRRKQEEKPAIPPAEQLQQVLDRLQRYDPRNIDIFGYTPVYTFPGYRSNVGAWSSIILIAAVALRCGYNMAEFADPTVIISENKVLFPFNPTQEFELPILGLTFKQTGWRPFFDPNYFTFEWRQGFAGRAGNATYIDLGDRPCVMTDSHGRIIEDTARCPAHQPSVQGSYFDETYKFLHVRMLRCHNGTDASGRAQPGPCRTAEEIDRLVYEGTITLGVEQRDLDAAASDPFDQLLLFKKTFSEGVHATFDVYFTVRAVTQLPRWEALETTVRAAVVGGGGGWRRWWLAAVVGGGGGGTVLIII